jgi:predicted N-acyltransferase
MCCGVPVSAGQSQVGFADGADRGQAILEIDQSLRLLARKQRAGMIVFKEFEAADLAATDVLQSQGYFRADSPPMYDLIRSFPDFEGYCAALRSHYRADIRRSQRKFERAGCQVVHHRGPGEIVPLYTPDVHRLYEAVVAKSEVKLELLPVAFFHRLAERLGDRITLTAVYREGRMIAFNWGMGCGPEYHFLFCGIDYRENAAADLYFNVMYHQLDLAYRSGSQLVRFGQTADAFKARVGCTGAPRYFYARGTGSVRAWIVRQAAGLLGPPRSPKQEHDVFKAPTSKTKKQATGKDRVVA